MKKKAGLASAINQIINQIKSPKPSVLSLLSKEPGRYPSLSKVRGINLGEFNIKPATGPSNALGFVSTTDIDGDGYVDTINVVSPVIEQEFRKAYNKDISQFHLLGDDDLAMFLNYFSEIILHEREHLGGKPLKYEEGVGFKPESAAQAAVPKPNKAEDSRSKKARAEHLKKLKKLASDLSQSGDEKLSVQIADLVDRLSVKRKK